MRGDVKTHAVPAHGNIVRLLQDYGFIETAEGEVHFHRNSVTGGGFDDLQAGQQVHFVITEKEGEHGLQAP